MDSRLSLNISAARISVFLSREETEPSLGRLFKWWESTLSIIRKHLSWSMFLFLYGWLGSDTSWGQNFVLKKAFNKTYLYVSCYFSSGSYISDMCNNQTFVHLQSRFLRVFHYYYCLFKSYHILNSTCFLKSLIK